MSGSCHIQLVEIVISFLFSFKFSAEQKSDLKEYKSLLVSFEDLSLLS